MLADVTRVECADVEQLAFLYQDRISVLLGTGNELDYKLDYAEYMLLNREGKGCAPTDTGHLDCSHLHGTDCYCDAEGAKSIQNIIAPYPAEGIHFIDSGDYHYVTKFWTDVSTDSATIFAFPVLNVSEDPTSPSTLEAILPIFLSLSCVEYITKFATVSPDAISILPISNCPVAWSAKEVP